MEVSMPEAHKRAYRHPKYKTSYRIKNWSKYEKSLRNRGDITVWLSRDAIDAWTPPKNGKRGGQLIYSDIAIGISLALRAALFNNTIRASCHRDNHIAEIRSKGRSEWKRQFGYYLQSHAENAFCRYKRIIYGGLRAKNYDAQKLEAAISCAILNQMRDMCRLLSYAVG